MTELGLTQPRWGSTAASVYVHTCVRAYARGALVVWSVECERHAVIQAWAVCFIMSGTCDDLE